MAKEIVKQTFNYFVPRFALEPYSGRKSRCTCPQCGKKEVYTKYIDLTTGDYLDDLVGRCNRETKCGYHQPPTKEIIEKVLKEGEAISVPVKQIKEEYLSVANRTDLIDSKHVVESLSNYEDNNFVRFLLRYFPREEVMKTINLYRVGTSDKWKGATVFWQIDEEFDTRTGKIMLYDELEGKRVKEPFSHITWFHTPDNKVHSDFSLRQCFFGQHLLNENNMSTLVCVVESEKTAVICNLSKTNCIWLATGGLQNITEEKIYALKDRKVVFYPDKGEAFDKWCEKLSPYIELGDFKVSNYLNKIDDLEEGDDLGDLVIQKLTT